MTQRTQTGLDFGNAGNWNTIEVLAGEIVTQWNGETYERGENQSLWADFPAVLDDPLTMPANLRRAVDRL